MFLNFLRYEQFLVFNFGKTSEPSIVVLVLYAWELYYKLQFCVAV